MKAPQTGRRPLALAAEDLRKELRKRHEADKSDPFATDPNSEISELGKLALRRNEIDYYFALGDLCTERSASQDNKLRVFYIGKALIGYGRALQAAKNDVDRTIARRAIDSLGEWVLDIALKTPSQRNLAAALWTIARDENDELPAPTLERRSQMLLLQAYHQALKLPMASAPEQDTAFDTQHSTNATRADGIREDALSDASATRMSPIAPDEDQSAAMAAPGALSPLETQISNSVEQPVNEFTSLEHVSDPTDYHISRPGVPRPKTSPKPEEHDFQLGQRIEGRYEVVDIRVGGMGVVYLCYDHERREPVAIKTFQKRFLDNEKAVLRFEQEAYMWIRLEKHAHIVQARLVQNINSRPHIFLEHISGMEGVGVDLRSWIDHNRLTLPHSLTFALHIALGMQHATTRIPGLVHRDLKPGNILVTHDGIAKITDFGLVRSLDDSRIVDEQGNSGGDDDDQRDQDYRLTRVNALVGTPPYMSPEQCEASVHVDMRSDIYGFGTVLFEMLTGQHAFRVRGAKNWREAHLKEIPEFDARHRAMLPSNLQDLVLRCMAKKPEDRPQDWQTVVEELSDIYQSAIGELPTLATDGTALQARELMDKGYSLTELGRLEEAIEAYERAIDLQPDYAWAWARKGRTLRLMERHAESLTAYDRALNIQPDYAWAYNGKGIVLDRLNRPEEALDAFTAATEQNPNDVWYWYNRGDMLDKLGQRDMAIRTLERGLQIDPRHPNSYARLGQIYRMMRRYEDSIHAYEQATRLQPDYAWAHNGCGLSLKALGRLTEAIIAFKRASRYLPDVVWHWYNLAETLVSMGRYQEAMQPAREATRVDPLHAPAWSKLGQVLRYMKRLDEALNAYERAVELDELFDWALNGKGIVLEQLGRYEEALKCYTEATALNPHRDWYLYNQANALMLLERSDEALPLLERALEINPQYARSHALRGSILRRANQLDQSRIALQTAVQLLPDYAWAWSELGATHEALRDYEDALTDYINANRHEPGKPNHLYKQADVLVLMDRYEQALDALEKALKLNNRSAHIWAKHGQVLRKLDRLDEALQSYTHAVELEPDYGWAWSGRGLTLSAMNRHDEALYCFKRALELDANDVWYWYNYAEELLAKHDYAAAVEALDNALALDPQHPESWSKCGQALRSLGRLEEALNAYNKAVKYNPNFGWAWNGRGLTLKELGRQEEAIESYDRAIQTEPRIVWYYINRVVTLLDMGRREEALATIDQAIQVAPNNATVWARRGQVQRRLYRYEQALESYNQALALDANYAWAWNGKGMCMAHLNHWDDALICYQLAVKHDANDAWFWHNYGEALEKHDRLEEAEKAYMRALTVDSHHEFAHDKLHAIRDKIKKRDDNK